MGKRGSWALGVVVALGASLALAPLAAGEGLIPRRELSLELAKKMAEAAIAACQKNGWNVTVAIADVHGNLKLLQRTDEAHAASIRIGIGKARTAAILRNSTEVIQTITRPDKPAWGLQHVPGVLPLRGGLPIKVGNETVGAIGVSGAPGGDKDEVCAKAALEAFAREVR